MELHKVKLKDLSGFINSDFYKNQKIKPISPKRALSYINNPNGDPQDTVLYYFLKEKKIIAFRTIWADIINDNDNLIKFGWLSGNWVSHEYRGKGLAKRIFKEIFSDWNGKLMFSNYSPEGLKSNKNDFNVVYKHRGIRAYYSVSLKKILKNRDGKKILKFLSPVVDTFVVLLSKFLKIFYSTEMTSEYLFKLMDRLDEDCMEYVENNKADHFFKKGAKEFLWMFSYPWVTNNKSDEIPEYPFSSYAKEFYYKVVKIFRNENFVGFFIFSVRDGYLKFLYSYFEIKYIEIVAKWLKNYVIANNLEVITIYNEELSILLRKKSFPFLYIKDFQMNIYGTFTLPQNLKMKVQDGDGDYFFT